MLLADEMGLGKTIQAIGALRVLLRDGASEPALVVVPAGLVLQWRRQFREWAPELTLSTCIGRPEERRQRWRAMAQVYLTGFDSLRSDMALPAPNGPRGRMWQVVVVDEAQRIKNAHTAVAAAITALPRRRAWALTGTPLENCADDTASILDVVAPGLYDPATMIAGLRRALSMVQLRRRRAEVLHELPPKTVFELAPDLLPVQRAAYDIAHREGLVWLRSLGTELRVTHVLELILRLKQICNACPRTGASSKLDDLNLSMANDPLLDHLERTFADAYRKEIDQEENVWRSLPFFAATVALQLTALAQIRDWISDIVGPMFAVASMLLTGAGAATLAALGFLAMSVWPADFRRVAREPAFRDYADRVRAEAEANSPPGTALREVAETALSTIKAALVNSMRWPLTTTGWSMKREPSGAPALGWQLSPPSPPCWSLWRWLC